VLLAKFLEASDKFVIKILNNVDVSLLRKMDEYFAQNEKIVVHALTRQTYGPTASTIESNVSFLVTSTLTHKLLCLCSIISSNRLAAGLVCSWERWA
jgi:hypothetical protein